LAGTSGSVNNVLVNGADVLGNQVGFITDLPTTASAVCTQINAYQNRYTATSIGAVITLSDIPDTGAMHNGYSVSVNLTSLTATYTALAGGVDAVVTVPEINPMHHRHLVKWMLYRAYQKADAETLNPDKSAKSLAEFEDYFGTRPDADLRKQQFASTPHASMCYA
jgi:hypothetical protein